MGLRLVYFFLLIIRPKSSENTIDGHTIYRNTDRRLSRFVFCTTSCWLSRA